MADPLVLSAKADVERAVGALGFYAKGVPTALAVALTRTAWRIAGAEKATMASVFDRPTPYTINSVRVTQANRANLVAKVRLSDDAYKSISAAAYLAPQVYGGDRNLKRFERALQLRGLMPSGWFAVPTREARYDAYGNVSKGQIQQILSQLGAQNARGYHATLDKNDPRKVARAEKRAGGLFFTVSPGSVEAKTLRPGVWLRRNFTFFGGSHAVKPIFLFVRSVRYKIRFPFYDVGTQVFQEYVGNELRQSLIQFAPSARILLT